MTTSNLTPTEYAAKVIADWQDSPETNIEKWRHRAVNFFDDGAPASFEDDGDSASHREYHAMRVVRFLQHVGAGHDNYTESEFIAVVAQALAVRAAAGGDKTAAAVAERLVGWPIC